MSKTAQRLTSNVCPPEYGWAWAIQDLGGQGWLLCYHICSTRSELLRTKKPSSEARAVPVVLKQYRSKARKGKR